jgi:ribonuclease HII
LVVADGAVGASAAAVETYLRLEAFDRRHYSGGHRIAGVDEAGRGALAGPVVSAAVILPPDSGLLGVDDSKRLTEKRRDELFLEITSTANAVSIAVGQPSLIDEQNILQATLITMHRAVSRLRPRPDLVLVDGRDTFQWEGRIVAVTKGDNRSLSIAAASIVAKVARDRLMRKLHNHFPEYNFSKNKGYGTKEHLDAIIAHGVAAVHRTSFRPKVVEKNLSMFKNIRGMG